MSADVWIGAVTTLGGGLLGEAARAELGVSGPAEPRDSRDQLAAEGQVPA